MSSGDEGCKTSMGRDALSQAQLLPAEHPRTGQRARLLLAVQ